MTIITALVTRVSEREAIEHRELLGIERLPEMGTRLEQPLRVDEIGETFGTTTGRIASGANLLAHQINDANHSKFDLFENRISHSSCGGMGYAIS